MEKVRDYIEYLTKPDINPTFVMHTGMKLPGPRLSPKYLSDTLIEDAKNILWIEQ